jgi:Flp pilus assembly protein TadD
VLLSDKIDEAIEHLRIAIRMKPHDADFHFSLGLALEKKSRVDEAIAHIQKALVIKPGYELATQHLNILILKKTQGAAVRGSDDRDRQ